MSMNIDIRIYMAMKTLRSHLNNNMKKCNLELKGDLQTFILFDHNKEANIFSIHRDKIFCIIPISILLWFMVFNNLATLGSEAARSRLQQQKRDCNLSIVLTVTVIMFFVFHSPRIIIRCSACSDICCCDTCFHI